MQHFLRALRKDHRVVVIPLGGSNLIRSGVESELAELSRLCSRVYALIDSERQSEEEELSASRSEFLEACRVVGIAAHVLERRATENYFSERAIRAALGESFRALGPFEKLSQVENGWAKRDSWRVATETPFSEIANTDLGFFLSSI